ncbi:hypothetical protein HYC85_018500 [Camellia sinensis]|uniref:Uncharacterized protein n=1 Tax=Camellia sinensis TaxID=4442 RepID=A0A7J7GUG4_CAMSI|nr:hypothetical protein HYC85_018500 [Camellia sinensis]
MMRRLSCTRDEAIVVLLVSRSQIRTPQKSDHSNADQTRTDGTLTRSQPHRFTCVSLPLSAAHPFVRFLGPPTAPHSTAQHKYSLLVSSCRKCTAPLNADPHNKRQR